MLRRVAPTEECRDTTSAVAAYLPTRDADLVMVRPVAPRLLAVPEVIVPFRAAVHLLVLAPSLREVVAVRRLIVVTAVPIVALQPIAVQLPALPAVSAVTEADLPPQAIAVVPAAAVHRAATAVAVPVTAVRRAALLEELVRRAVSVVAAVVVAVASAAEEAVAVADPSVVVVADNRYPDLTILNRTISASSYPRGRGSATNKHRKFS